MATAEQLRALCFDEGGAPRSKSDCRATLINHLILDELMDVDEAEELTEDTLNKLDLWPKEEAQEELSDDDEDELSTDD